jgi:hypothetical protein
MTRPSFSGSGTTRKRASRKPGERDSFSWLIGTAKQIEDILLSSDWNPSSRDFWIPNTKELVEQCRKHPAIPIELDRADKPKGIAIPMNIVVRAKENLYSVLRKLHSGKNPPPAIEVLYPTPGGKKWLRNP